MYFSRKKKRNGDTFHGKEGGLYTDCRIVSRKKTRSTVSSRNHEFLVIQNNRWKIIGGVTTIPVNLSFMFG